MTKYQVHFEKTTNKGTKHGIRTINARNEAEAILKVKSVVQASFGHWVNRLANEGVHTQDKQLRQAEQQWVVLRSQGGA